MVEISARTDGTPKQADTRLPAEAVRKAGEDLKASTTQAVGEITAQVRQAADEQRHKAATSLGGIAQVLHRAANDLQTENIAMGRYTHMAAERLDEAALFLRQSDWNQMIEGAENFARRQPWWFVGGAVAAGFVAARIAKGAVVTPPSSAGTGYVAKPLYTGGLSGEAL